MPESPSWEAGQSGQDEQHAVRKLLRKLNAIYRWDRLPEQGTHAPVSPDVNTNQSVTTRSTRRQRRRQRMHQDGGAENVPRLLPFPPTNGHPSSGPMQTPRPELLDESMAGRQSDEKNVNIGRSNDDGLERTKPLTETELIRTDNREGRVCDHYPRVESPCPADRADEMSEVPHVLIGDPGAANWQAAAKVATYVEVEEAPERIFGAKTRSDTQPEHAKASGGDWSHQHRDRETKLIPASGSSGEARLGLRRHHQDGVRDMVGKHSEDGENYCENWEAVGRFNRRDSSCDSESPLVRRACVSRAGSSTQRKRIIFDDSSEDDVEKYGTPRRLTEQGQQPANHACSLSEPTDSPRTIGAASGPKSSSFSDETSRDEEGCSFFDCQDDPPQKRDGHDDSHQQLAPDKHQVSLTKDTDLCSIGSNPLSEKYGVATVVRDGYNATANDRKASTIVLNEREIPRTRRNCAVTSKGDLNDGGSLSSDCDDVTRALTPAKKEGGMTSQRRLRIIRESSASSVLSVDEDPGGWEHRPELRETAASGKSRNEDEGKSNCLELAKMIARDPREGRSLQRSVVQAGHGATGSIHELRDGSASSCAWASEENQSDTEDNSVVPSAAAAAGSRLNDASILNRAIRPRSRRRIVVDETSSSEETAATRERICAPISHKVQGEKRLGWRGARVFRRNSRDSSGKGDDSSRMGRKAAESGPRRPARSRLRKGQRRVLLSDSDSADGSLCNALGNLDLNTLGARRTSVWPGCTRQSQTSVQSKGRRQGSSPDDALEPTPSVVMESAARVSSDGHGESSSDRDGQSHSSWTGASHPSDEQDLSAEPPVGLSKPATSASEKTATPSEPQAVDTNEGGGKGPGRRVRRTPHQGSRKIDTEGNLSGAAFARARDSLTAKYFEDFNEGAFGCALSEVKVSWNKRLNSTAGVTKSFRRNAAFEGDQHFSRVELSFKVVDSESKLKETLLHELCHAAAWVIDHKVKPPHGTHFWRWADRAKKAFPLIPVTTCHAYDINFKYRYVCVGRASSGHDSIQDAGAGCGAEIGRHSKSIDVAKQVCGRCRGQLKLFGTHGKDGKLKKSRTASGFSLFVKNHYADVKREMPPGTKQQDVMKEMSRRWASRDKGEQENADATLAKTIHADNIVEGLKSLSLTAHDSSRDTGMVDLT